MIAEIDIYLRLGLAFGIGLMIGIERGWRSREAAAGTRVAGIRTFPLIGLSGGLFALAGSVVGEAVLAVGAAGLFVLLAAAYVLHAMHNDDRDMTSEVAAVLTFILGAIAVRGDPTLAAAFGVIVVATLALKESAHRWLASLEQTELMAAIKVLVISVVVLPFVPDRAYGPGGALNPYEIWLIVAVLAALSLFGYAAVRMAGPRVGLLLLGLLGGIASSTATTINASRLAVRAPAMAPRVVAAVAASVTVMFARILLVSAVLKPPLALQLAVPLGASLLASAALAFMWSRRKTHRDHEHGQRLDLGPPADIGGALEFAVILTLITLGTELAREWLGTSGILATAAISGAVDVDAVTVAMSRMAGGQDAPSFAMQAVAILLATAVNGIAKTVYAVAIAGRLMARDMFILLGVTLATLAGGAAVTMVG